MSSKGKKGKKKGKDKKVVDPNKLTQVDRQFCELTITDLNRKLARLRTHLADLDDTNVNLSEQLRSLEEDRVDVAAHLERTLNERNNEIKSLEEQLLEVTTVRDEENREAAEHIKALEAKYKAMHDQLQSEIKLLNGKLNSLDEFRIQRDVLMAKFQEQEQMIKDKDEMFTETKYDFQLQQILQKKKLQERMEVAVLRVSQDFQRASKIRKSGYIQRLIRENVALQNELDKLITSQIKIRQRIADQDEKNAQISSQYSSLLQIRKFLIKWNRNKVKMIEKLATQYEHVKIKYIEALRYRNLYEKIISQNLCEHFSVKELKKDVRRLDETVDILKNEKKRMTAEHVSHEMEIQRLRRIIESIKHTVLNAVMDTTIPKSEKSIEILDSEEQIGTEEQEYTSTHELAVFQGIPNAITLQNVQLEKRKNLLSDLIHILSTDTAQISDSSSVSTIDGADMNLYRKGKLGLVPRETSLRDMFRKVERKFEKPESIVEFRAEDHYIIPKECSSAGAIVDPIVGDYFFVSSSHEDVGIVHAEEDVVGEEEAVSSEFGSSSYQTEANTDQQNTTQPTQRVTEIGLTKGSKIELAKEPSIAKSSAPTDVSEGEEEDDFIDFFY